MKQYLYAFSMAQSMFCRIPWPFSVWDEKARGKMLLFLPVVGLEIGFIWALGWYLSVYFGLEPMLRGLILCVLPFLLTGFIHLDGFMDVTDAVGSCRDLDKRRAILKDSHVGAFAVIGCVILMLAQFSFCSCVEQGGILLLIPVVSRCCSALAVTVLPPMSTSQYAGRRVSKGNIVVLCVMLTATLAAGLLFWGKWALSLLGALAGYGLALGRSYRALEGMNGDISGYSLTMAELAGLAVLALL